MNRRNFMKSLTFAPLLVFLPEDVKSDISFYIRSCSHPNFTHMIVTEMDIDGVAHWAGDGCNTDNMGRVYERAVKNAPYLRHNTIRDKKKE